MITLKSPREIEAMEKAGAALAGMHLGIREFIKPEFLAGRLKNLPGSTLRLPVLKQNKSVLKDTSTQPVSALMMKFVTAFPART